VKARSRARGWALQALYAWEARGGGEDRLVPILEELYENLRVSPRNRLYTDVLVRLAARNLPRIDRVLEGHLTNWSLRRLAVVDRNILRLGAAELLFVDDVPPRVTIREMIRLAERYGTPESPRFVNGVLDAVMRHVDAEGAPGPR
jgi:N utilization substance protein B